MEAELRIANFCQFITEDSRGSLQNVQPTTLLTHERIEFNFYMYSTQHLQSAKISYANYIVCLINLRIGKMQNRGFSITGIDDTLLQRLTNSRNMIVVTVLDQPYMEISVLSDEGWEEYTIRTVSR